MVIINARNRTEGAWVHGRLPAARLPKCDEGGTRDRQGTEPRVHGTITGWWDFDPIGQGGIKHGVQAKVAVTSTNLRGNLYQIGTAR